MKRKLTGLTLIGLAGICIALSLFFSFRATPDGIGGGLPIGDTGDLNWKVLEDYAAISGVIGVILGAVGGWHLISIRKT